MTAIANDKQLEREIERTQEEEAGTVPAGRQPEPQRISPKMEHAIRMYATGQLADQRAAAALAGVHPNRFGFVLNSTAGQAIVNDVRSALNFQYQTLYSKFIKVVSDGLDHPDPGVALSAANLFAKTQIGSKVSVNLTAEDVIQSIINGTYTDGQ